jgi:hypothetical protein
VHFLVNRAYSCKELMWFCCKIRFFFFLIVIIQLIKTMLMVNMLTHSLTLYPKKLLDSKMSTLILNPTPLKREWKKILTITKIYTMNNINNILFNPKKKKKKKKGQTNQTLW